MFIGLDIGGTHTDAVLIDGNRVVNSEKTVTHHHNLLESINNVLKKITENIDRGKINRINLSTTLSTNAIVEDTIEDVGLIISAGPGIDPENFKLGSNFYIIPGSIDHRGTEIKPLDSHRLNSVVEECMYKNILAYAVVTKFSTRNPDHENIICGRLDQISDFNTPGHKISGHLSFPRRIATAYYNSAVWRIYNTFADAVEESIKNLGIDAMINILKADGGTMPFSESKKFPVESILSGPAASIMGIIALCKISDDSIILDIGGTTTDIAIFASGSPIIEKDGITLKDKPTLVRALHTKSIGIGGDSIIKVTHGNVTVGPEREGAAMADGGDVPTLVDALNFNNVINYGFLDKSKSGIEQLAAKNNINPVKLAESAEKYAVEKIIWETEKMLNEINNSPVYTVHEMVEAREINPDKIYIMGGPAAGFAKLFSENLKKDVIIPDNYQVANAIGAAVAKTTFDIELFADTGKGILLIPNLDVKTGISKDYSLEDAENDAVEYLQKHLEEIGGDNPDIEIIESSSFNMVSGFSGSGKDIRVKCQVKPGVLTNIEN